MSKRFTFTILFMLIACFSLFSQVSDYNAERIVRINVGSNEGMLGYREYPGGYYGPGEILFTRSDQIAIIDSINVKINYYDKNMNYNQAFSYKVSNSEYSSEMTNSFVKISDSQSFYCILGRGLQKIDNNLNQVYYVKDNLPSSVGSFYHYWLYGDKVLMYSDNGKPMVLDEIGTFLNDGEVQKLMEEMKEQSKLRKDNYLRVVIDQFLAEKQLFYVDDQIITDDFWTFDEYRKLMKKNLFGKKAHDRVNGWEYDLGTYSPTIKGRSTNGNIFVSLVNKQTGKKQSYIFSKFGEVLSIYTIKYPGTGQGSLEYSPWGDLYWYELIKNNGVVVAYDFYRVKNVWDPVETGQ